MTWDGITDQNANIFKYCTEILETLLVREDIFWWNIEQNFKSMEHATKSSNIFKVFNC